jgi:hypothetical protein
LDVDQYVNNLLSQKPAELQSNDYIDKIYVQMESDTSSRPQLKVVHLSDIHIDFDYAEGSNAQCDLPICCRAANGYTNEEHN